MLSLRNRLTLTMAATMGLLCLAAGIFLRWRLPAALVGPVWLVLVGLALTATLGCYLWTYRFSRRLEELLPVAVAAASGDLEQQANILTGDEVGRLAACINEIILRWRGSLRQISREKEQLDAILTSMSDGVVAVDQVGRVVLVNRAAREMLHLAGTGATGRSILETVRHHEVDAVVRAVLAGGRAVEKEIKLHPAAPTVYRLSVVPIIGQAGRLNGAVLVMQDVTRVRRLEKMRSEFVANVSHELRTPLTSIKGFAETLLEGAAADEELRRKFLGIIIAEANRLHDLINDVLILSHIENHQVELKQGQADVGRVVAKVQELLAPMAQAKGVALMTALPATVPLLPIHEDYLGQIILNLVDNAVKFTPAGGEVSISATNGENEVAITVKDTGLGIPAEALPRLFERFYRVDKARSREMGGTGLGLAIVKHLLERHGGRITVSSTPGKGASFICTLPVLQRRLS